MKVHKKLLVRNHSTIVWKITIFTLHKVLLFAALLAMVILDIKGGASIQNDWSNAAVASGYPVTASSEQLGANIRHAALGTDAYNSTMLGGP